MDSSTPHPRVKNILYTTFSSETTEGEISISLFKRHSKYLKTLYVNEYDVFRYSKMRTIKRLHSLEMPTVQNQGQFNHLYKLLKPQKHDVSLKRIGLSSLSLDQQSLIWASDRINPKNLEPNIIKLLRNTFKISSLTIFYPTDYASKITIGKVRCYEKSSFSKKLEKNDRWLLSELNSMKKLLGSIRCIKLDLCDEGGSKVEESFFKSILNYQNIIANTTMITFTLGNVEDAVQFLLHNHIKLQRLPTISLECSSDQEDSTYLELSKTLTLFPKLKNLHLLIKSPLNLINNFMAPLDLGDCFLEFFTL